MFGHTPHAADYLFGVSVSGGEGHAVHLIWSGVQRLRELGVPFLEPRRRRPRGRRPRRVQAPLRRPRAAAREPAAGVPAERVRAPVQLRRCQRGGSVRLVSPVPGREREHGGALGYCGEREAAPRHRRAAARWPSRLCSRARLTQVPASIAAALRLVLRRHAQPLVERGPALERLEPRKPLYMPSRWMRYDAHQLGEVVDGAGLGRHEVERPVAPRQVEVPGRVAGPCRPAGRAASRTRRHSAPATRARRPRGPARGRCTARPGDPRPRARRERCGRPSRTPGWPARNAACRLSLSGDVQ